MADVITGSSDIFTVLSNQQSLRENAANTALSNGVTLMERKKFAEAATAFKQAAAYSPAMANAYTFLGDAYTRAGNKKDAAAAYELSLKVDRTQDTVYSSLANTYVDLNRSADAEKILQKAVKQNNMNTPAFYTLGLMQAKRGDYTSAEGQFKQVIKLEPKDGNGYYALGMALNGQGKYREAINPLEQATKLKKNFDSALFELGKAYVNLGDTDKVQTQIDLLDKISTSIAAVSAADLAEQIRKPGIYYYDANKSTLQLTNGPIDLSMLDPATFATPDSSKDMTVSFVFDSSMDQASVTNAANWSISKATGGIAGIYNNGLYSPLNSVPIIPKRVTYDLLTNEATLTFTINQNSTADASIDPSHLVFRFNGTDGRGMTMDPAADQYDGFKLGTF